MIAQQAKHDAQNAEYEEKYKAYVEEDKKYQLWLVEQELEKLISKISKIKNEQ